MNDNEIRNAILEFAYNKAKEFGIIEEGRFLGREISKLERLEGIEKNRIDLNVEYMEKKHLIKWVTMEKMVITFWGIYHYEEEHPEVLLVVPKGSTMTDNEIRYAILEFANDKAEKAGSIELGRFVVYEISKLKGIEKNRIDFNADYLDKEDSLKWIMGAGRMTITAKGIDKYEKKGV